MDLLHQHIDVEALHQVHQNVIPPDSRSIPKPPTDFVERLRRATATPDLTVYMTFGPGTSPTGYPMDRLWWIGALGRNNVLNEGWVDGGHVSWVHPHPAIVPMIELTGVDGVPLRGEMICSPDHQAAALIAARDSSHQVRDGFDILEEHAEEQIRGTRASRAGRRDDLRQIFRGRINDRAAHQMIADFRDPTKLRDERVEAQRRVEIKRHHNEQRELAAAESFASSVRAMKRKRAAG